MEKQIIWKDVPGFPGYEVSEHGDLRRDSFQLKPEVTWGTERKRFTLCRDGAHIRLKAAQLVALAFIGPQPFDGAEVCHNDGFKNNDHYSNLRWDTHQANMADMVRHNLERKTRAGLHVSTRARLSAAGTAWLAAGNRPI